MHKPTFSLKGIFLLLTLTALVVAGFVFVGKNYRHSDKKDRAEIAGASISNDSSHPLEIYYGSVKYTNLNSMLKELNVKVWPEDKVQTLPSPEMGIGSQILIRRATPVEITDSKVTKEYRTWQEKVGGLLEENKIELLGKDSIEPGLTTPIEKNLKIKITRVAEVEVLEKEPIDFKITKKEDIELEKGKTKVEQKGIKGEREIKYLVKRVDGVETSRKVLEKKIVKEPIIEIMIIGIGPKYVSSGPFKDWLNQAAKKTLVNATALQCLMMRESGGTPETGYPDAYYKGLFQYDEGYWESASTRAGFAGASIYDAKAQIFTTAYEIARGQSRRWPPYQHCKDK